MLRYDVFLSYHTTDRAAVQTVRPLLETRGLTTFLDRAQLVAGLPWPHALEEGLRSVRSVAVFLGRDGFGLWQKREMWFALDRQVHEERAGRQFPVIPVLLPGATDLTPSFLCLNTWIDLREDVTSPEGLDTLVCAVRGQQVVSPSAGSVLFCPYRALQAFREEDRAFFFGRDTFAEDLLATVLTQKVTTVVGPSGSGKSSVVHAGLLPLLRRQRPPAKTWDVVSLTPGTHPFARLAAALMPFLEPTLRETDWQLEAEKLGAGWSTGMLRLGTTIDRVLQKAQGTDQLLVIVDQFEELFTTTPSAAREPFVRLLLQALDESHLSLVLTLRADFYGHAIDVSRAFSDRMQRGVINIGPMTSAELHQVITEPAKRVGLTFAVGLADRLYADVSHEPGNLPLLEFALTELWARRTDGHLTHTAYEASGQVAGAIAQRAEQECQRFVAQGQEPLVRHLFTRLVRVARPHEGRGDTRVRVNLRDLPDAVHSIVQTLTDARLLVTGRDPTAGHETVEVAHEALIRHWRRLQGWVDQDRAFLLWRQRLQGESTEWQRLREDAGMLLRGARLTEAERWREERPHELNAGEQRFVNASVELRQREDQERERRRKTFTMGLIGGLVGALCLAGLAGWQWRQANAQRKESDKQRQFALARQLAAQAERVSNQQASLLPVSVLLAIEALQRLSSLETDQALRNGLTLLPHPLHDLRHEGPVNAVSFSPDGHLVVSGSGDKTVRVWESATGKEVARMAHEDAVNAVSFSPNGHLVVSGSGDSTVRVWESATGKEVARMAHEDAVNAVSFSPDGRLVVSGSKDKTVRVWERAAGKEVARMAHQNAVKAVRFSPDGRLVVSGSGMTVRVWESATSKEVARMAHEGWVSAVHFSPDGRLVVSGSGETVLGGSGDSTVRVWESATGKEIARMTHEDAVNTVSFSPDGRLVVSGSRDKTVRVWESITGKEIARMAHEDAVNTVSFSPDGRLVVSGSKDKTVRVWESAAGKEVAHMAHQNWVNAVHFSPDGRLVVSGSGEEPLRGSGDNTVRVWESATGKEVARMTHQSLVNAVSFSPDGRLVVSGSGATFLGGSRDNTVRVWESTTGKEVARMTHEDAVNAVSFSPDGRLVVSGSRDNTVRVWESTTGKEVARMTHEDAVNAVSFSPDGRLIVSGSGEEPFRRSRDNTVRVWESTTGKEIARTVHQSPVNAVSFSPDGRLVVSGSWDKTVRVWESTTGKEVARMAHEDAVNTVSFSPDGRLVVSGSRDKTVRVWESITGKEIARMAHEDAVNTVSFSPDGRLVVSGSGEHFLSDSRDNTVRVWESTTGKEVARMTHEGPVRAVRFSPDGRLIVSGSEDNTVRMHRWRPEDLITEACARLTRNLTEGEWRLYLGNEPYQKTCKHLPEEK